MSQTKPAGSIVKKYSSVYVFISKGSEFLDLSQYSFTNMNTTAIEELLRPKGILTKFQTEYSDAVAEGQVIRYEPQKPKMGDTVMSVPVLLKICVRFRIYTIFQRKRL